MTTGGFAATVRRSDSRTVGQLNSQTVMKVGLSH